jgi:hypothetical protein
MLTPTPSCLPHRPPRREVHSYSRLRSPLISIDAEMTELYLRLGPRQCGGTLECIGVVMLVDQAQHIGARRCNNGPEANAHHLAGLNPHTTSKRKLQYRYNRAAISHHKLRPPRWILISTRDKRRLKVVGDRAIIGSAASASQMGRFETKWLSRPENLAALANLPGQWIDKVHQRRPPKTIVLDMDSSESPTYGEQEGSAYNGHFGCTCYHPLFVFNQLGDVERCALRPGNVHSADGWRAVLEPVVARYRGVLKRLYFRGDAAFANPEIYEFLEGADGCRSRSP